MHSDYQLYNATPLTDLLEVVSQMKEAVEAGEDYEENCLLDLSEAVLNFNDLFKTT